MTRTYLDDQKTKNALIKGVVEKVTRNELVDFLWFLRVFNFDKLRYRNKYL